MVTTPFRGAQRMSNSQQSGTTFGPRFIISFIIILGIWVAWQSHLAKKYPDAYKRSTDAAQTQVHTEANVNPSEPAAKENATIVGQPKSMSLGNKVVEEKRLTYSNEDWEFQISSRGMALQNIQLKNYTSRDKQPVKFSSYGEYGQFATSLVGRTTPLDFDIKQTSENEFIGQTQVDGMNITKVLQIDSKKYLISTQITIQNVSAAVTGLTTNFSEEIMDLRSGFFLMPSFEHQDFYINHEGKSTRISLNPKDEIKETHKQTKIAGVGTQYFALALIDESPIYPEFNAAALHVRDTKKAYAIGSLVYGLGNPSETLTIKYKAFAGPKSYDLLKTIDAEFTKLINFGFFTTIAKGIFWLMKTIHEAIGNWGIAIIFLTIIVRAIVLPLNLIGYRQMKAMTKIQPQIKIIREKYKNDAQKLNQEMLTLMKEAKANPLGGCMPMLVQIPVFFALYQVIGQSIELYQAPFIFWIKDLSLKDPFFILPALMGITMFIQQKITPSTLEPAQQKVMNFMPILFAMLMLTLPSGLTLYIFVSSVFGVVQQFYFMKEKKPTLVQA